MPSPLALLALLLTVLLAGCTGGDALERIETRGELRVVTRNSPATYYSDRDGAAGLEYALAGKLAEELGVTLRMQPAFSLADIFEALRRDDADIAAAGLTLTGKRAAEFQHSIPYHLLQPQVVYRTGNPRPKGPEDLLSRRVAVLAGSSHAELLATLQQESLPTLKWEEFPGADTMALLEAVDAGRFDVAVIDSHEFAVLRNLVPRLKPAFKLETEEALVWYLPPGERGARLRAYVDDFLQRQAMNGSLEALVQQHLSRHVAVSPITSHTFNLNVQEILPEYRGLMQQVAAEYNLDWRLLAAIAYQESHWNPLATSPTGVRGMMMLTVPTARELGVDNRLDPAQSLRGGARYLKDIRRRLPRRIGEPDRTWLALAAYNVGLGHLEDARVITQRNGGDPDQWVDVQQHLPLLQQSRHYQSTRHGYARGEEAAGFVENIRRYYNLLKLQDIAENRPSAPVQVDQYLPPALRDTPLLAL